MKDFKNYLCRICSSYRINAGLNYQDVSKRCGKSPSAIYRYERGETNSIDVLMWYIINFNIDIHKVYVDFMERRINDAKN